MSVRFREVPPRSERIVGKLDRGARTVPPRKGCFTRSASLDRNAVCGNVGQSRSCPANLFPVRVPSAAD
jgi:hypothetical protein